MNRNTVYVELDFADADDATRPAVDRAMAIARRAARLGCAIVGYNHEGPGGGWPSAAFMCPNRSVADALVTRFYGNKGREPLDSYIVFEPLDAAEVAKSLDTAIENGYDVLDGWTAAEIADDLASYDAGFEGVDPRAIAPHAQSWLDARRAAVR
jgi:hypothetical protein